MPAPSCFSFVMIQRALIFWAVLIGGSCQYPDSGLDLADWVYTTPCQSPNDDVIVLEDGLMAIPCSGYYATDDKVIMIPCVDGQWQRNLPDCRTSVQYECTHNSPPVPANAVILQNLTLDVLYGQYITCQEGFSWLSGRSAGYLRQCLQTGWTPIHDLCNDKCELPRDCSEISNFGLTESREYYITPHFLNDSIIVRCELGLPPNEGGGDWTVLLEQGTEYLAPDLRYFIGVENLTKLHSFNNGTQKPLVYQFLLKDAANVTRHATYSHVTINTASPYTLLSTGFYHGNANHQFQKNVGQDFICPLPAFTTGTFSDPSAMSTPPCNNWWAPEIQSSTFEEVNGTMTMTLVTNGQVIWPLLIPMPTWYIKLRARTVDYDNEVSCPILELAESVWKDAEITMNIGRSVGDTVSYMCIGEKMMTLNAAGEYATEGTITCQEGVNGGPPQWNGILPLPCTYTCEEPMFLTTAENSCLFVPEGTATFGIISAAKMCADGGGSLAVIQEGEQLTRGENGIFYYTAHSATIMNTTINPPLPDTLQCTTNCTVTGELMCVVVSIEGIYKVARCDDPSFQVLCSDQPPFCPREYVKMEGYCYKVAEVNPPGDFVSALQNCTADGAALAVPTNVDRLLLLKQLIKITLLRQSQAYTPESNETILIGLNNANRGDWTIEDRYNLDEDLLMLAEAIGDKHWQTLFIDSGNDVPSLEASTLEGGAATYALCQLHGGPLGCWNDPPVPTVNMTLVWDNTTTVNNTAVYTCLPGYYVNGNSSVTNQSLTCLGQLGGWYPHEFYDCFEIEVCLADIPIAPSPLMMNDTDLRIRYLGGTINFTCPPHMANENGTLNQSIVCSDFGGGIFGFHPQVLPCDVCYEEPTIVNGKSDWADHPLWTVNTTIQAECDSGHVWSLDSAEKTINCTEEGWDSDLNCYEACAAPPPEAGNNMIRDPFVNNTVGIVLEYNCNPGYHIPTSVLQKEILTSTNVTCSTLLFWHRDGPPLECEKLCAEEPFTPHEPATTTWDGYSRSNNSEVTLECPQEQFFVDMSNSKTLICEDGEKWTEVDESVYVCNKILEEMPPTPSSPDIIIKGPDPPYLVGTILEFICPENQFNIDGKSSTLVNATETGWIQLDPDFKCYNVCQTSPDAPVDPVTINGTYQAAIWNETVVTYTCPWNFKFSDSPTFHVKCQDGVWNPPFMPACVGKYLTHSQW